MSISIYQVDAFADRPFTGNPACVCLLEQPQSDSWLQSIAAEMNLSETAFVWRKSDHFHLRWFTPVAEVELCGHGTLATSHVLWESGWLAEGTVAVFDSLSGQLSAEKIGHKIFLDFPAKPPQPVAAPAVLLDTLDIEPQFIGTDGTDYMIAIDSEEQVRNLKPDFARLAEISERGVIVTAASAASTQDFVSRFFGPAVGINEDPVTGSAHCLLGPYWAEILGKQSLTGYQASNRGGFVEVQVAGDRVRLGGSAQIIFRGQLLV